MQKLSLGVQSFKKLREENLIYVDKTEDIYKLITEARYYFLSRPRRFGKSLLVNTLKELFLGNQHLFKGLWIEDKIEWESHPVIHLDFSSIDYKEQSLDVTLEQTLQDIAEKYSLEGVTGTYKEILVELIIQLSKKYQKQVVLLIDEYDKPLIDFLEDLDKADAHRAILKNFYSPLKSLDESLKFMFITGVSKFSKVSIFSDLNHLTDITIATEYATIVGYTQAEMEHYFQDYLVMMQAFMQVTETELTELIKKHYNGYSWNGQDKVYNPFSVLSFFGLKEIQNYWFSTGTPTFLTKLLQEDFVYDLKKLRVTGLALGNLNLRKPLLSTLLFQTGYLTIKEKLNYKLYRLEYPNLEVEESLNKCLLAEYMFKNAGDADMIALDILDALQEHDFLWLKDSFNALFGAIPQDYFIENREKFYAAIIFLTLKILGYFAHVEIPAGRGRLDAIVFLEDKIFLLEFKRDESPEEALKQIHERGYYKPYQNQQKDIYLLGFNFRTDKKEMDDILVEKL